MLANVRQTTIRPIIEARVAKGALVHTDEYDVYARLKTGAIGHKTVCHGRGEYARDEDGDGFCEVHVNTAEGFWSLLRSWLRPHRGISQEKLPVYLGFFQLVHNARRRGKALLGTLVVGLVASADSHHPKTDRASRFFAASGPGLALSQRSAQVCEPEHATLFSWESKPLLRGMTMPLPLRASLLAAGLALASLSAQAREFRSTDIQPGDYPTVEAVGSWASCWPRGRTAASASRSTRTARSARSGT
jgi:transposase-like protein